MIGIRTAAVLGILACNSMQDLKRREILGWPALLGAAAGIVCSLTEKVSGMEMVLSVLPGLFLYILSKTTCGKIGEGDGIVLTAAGAWGGIKTAFGICITAFYLVLAAAVILAICHRRKQELPFIPFLFLAECLLLALRILPF